MAAQANGIKEDSSGDLLEAGFVSESDFDQVITDNPDYSVETHTVMTDVPCPFKVKGDPGFSVKHNWNGSSWDEVADS